jgi:hypothetical protein
VLKTVDVTPAEAAAWVVEMPSAVVTGQTVVATTKVSVVTNVVRSVTGQSETVEGQAVMVAVRVERTVDVVCWTVSLGRTPEGLDPKGMGIADVISEDPLGCG